MHQKQNILNAKKSCTTFHFYFFFGSKLITGARAERLFLSQIRMPGSAWEFIGTFLVQNVKILFFLHKHFLKRPLTQITMSI